MAIVKSTKNPMQSYRKRTLFEVSEVYEDGSVYHGYYVENSSKTKKRAQVGS